jgi:hypothetical protein
MRIIALFFLLALSIFSKGQTSNPYLKLHYDKVIMYDFVGIKGLSLLIVDDKGQLSKSVKKQVQLEKGTISKLNVKLGDRKSFGEQPAACFDPHLGIVYYLAGKIVGHITICLSCHRLVSSINLPSQRQGRVGKGKDSDYIRDGISEKFQKFLEDLLLKNNFSLGLLPLPA